MPLLKPIVAAAAFMSTFSPTTCGFTQRMHVAKPSSVGPPVSPALLRMSAPTVEQQLPGVAPDDIPLNLRIDPNKSFTALCFGTGQGCRTPNTVVGAVLKLFRDERSGLLENQDFIAVDGPGHVGTSGTIPGTHAHDDLTRQYDKRIAHETYGWFGRLPLVAKAMDLIHGRSCAHSAATIVSAILHSLEAAPVDSNDPNVRVLPGVVNLVGYSRGAALTATHVYNLLKEILGPFDPIDERGYIALEVMKNVETLFDQYLSERNDLPAREVIGTLREFLRSGVAQMTEHTPMKVNLFLIDPVAGMNAGLDPKNQLMRNEPCDSVKLDNVVIIYAKHERRTTYKPQLPDVYRVGEDVNVRAVGVCGIHKTCADGNSRLTDPGSKRRDRVHYPEDWITPPAQFTASCAVRFLAAHGIDLRGPLEANANTTERKMFFQDLSDEGLKKLYQDMLANEDYYKQLSQGTGQCQRSRKDRLIEFVKALGSFKDRSFNSTEISFDPDKILNYPSFAGEKIEYN